MNTADTPVIFVVDDDDAMRRSLEWLLVPAGFRVCTFDGVDEFLSAYDGEPGCLILDVHLHDMNGIDFARELPALKIDLPVIVISGNADIPKAVDAMKAGAIDFVPKPFDGNKFLGLVQAAIEKSLLRRERRRGPHDEQHRTSRLTPRERQVMELVVTGSSSKEIAQKLGIGVRTVETYRSEMMRKLGVKSLAELIRLTVGREPG